MAEIRASILPEWMQTQKTDNGALFQMCPTDHYPESNRSRCQMRQVPNPRNWGSTMNLREMKKAIFFEVSKMLAESVETYGLNPYTGEVEYTWADSPRSLGKTLPKSVPGYRSEYILVPGGSLGERCWKACGRPDTIPARERYARAMWEVGQRITRFAERRPFEWNKTAWQHAEFDVQGWGDPR